MGAACAYDDMMMDVNLHLDICGVKKIETPEKLEERPGEEFFFFKT